MNRRMVGLASVLVMAVLSACSQRERLSPSDAGPLDSGSICAPPPTGDTRWAQYPMPGTPGHPRSYQVAGTPGAETVIDCVTGLEWQRDVGPGARCRCALAQEHRNALHPRRGAPS